MFISSTRQFQMDFSMFLRSRAAEVVPGGRMVLLMLVRETDCYTDRNTYLLWDLFSDSLAALVEEGLVDHAKVDAYDVPFYVSCAREIEEEVPKDGSFSLDYART
jgi:hypothetical protein